MRTPLVTACLSTLLVAIAGCDPETPAGPSDGGGGRTDAPAAIVDAGGGTDAPAPATDAGPPIVVDGGDVSGDWCGNIHVTASVVVPAGATLTVCAGSTVSLDDGVAISVAGTLALSGTAAARITLSAASGATRWGNLDVTGTLDGDFADLSRGTTCIQGRAGSTIRVDDSSVVGCQRSMSLASGGTFDRTTVRGGATLNVTGGILRMTDSVLDLEHDIVPPDCTDWAGGGAILDHVHFTGCHCPIHINSSTLEVTITNSILDGATNPVMIAESVATFHGNHFIGTGTLVLDIGRTGDIEADVAGNYWDGGAPDIGTTRPAQFTGTADFVTTPIPGVGPR